MDPDIVFGNEEEGERGGRSQNAEPLMVNLMGSWAYRPEATTEIPNMVLASDYVRTWTDGKEQ